MALALYAPNTHFLSYPPSPIGEIVTDTFFPSPPVGNEPGGRPVRIFFSSIWRSVIRVINRHGAASATLLLARTLIHTSTRIHTPILPVSLSQARIVMEHLSHTQQRSEAQHHATESCRALKPKPKPVATVFIGRLLDVRDHAAPPWRPSV